MKFKKGWLCALVMVFALSCLAFARDRDDLPYWSGLYFGPNLEYGEEYKIFGDPGEYLSAAEGAILTFYTMKENDNIPEYSDDLLYTMTLVDLAEDIEGEECYVYRLDVDEPSGTVGAAYAYAYQSGNIYMQGQGGQWVKTSGGIGAISDGVYVLNAQDADLSEAPDVIVEGFPPNLGGWHGFNRVNFHFNVEKAGFYTVTLNYSKQEYDGDRADLNMSVLNRGYDSVSAPLPSTGQDWSNYVEHEFHTIRLPDGESTLGFASTRPIRGSYVMNLRSVTLSLKDEE